MNVSTWNKNFNEVAASCGLNTEDVLSMDDGTVIGDTCWVRNGDKISVCVGNAIWTVTTDDLRKGDTHNV